MAKGKLSAGDLLKKGAVAGVKANGKAKTARPTLSGKEKMVDRVVEMKKQMEDLEREFEMISEQLTDEARKIYDAERKSHNYQTSIFAEGADTNGAMVIFPDRFCNIDSEHEEMMRKADSKFDSHFVGSRDIKLKKDAFNGKSVTDATIDLLRSKLGDDLLLEIFDIKIHIVAQSGLAEKWDEVPDTVKELVRQVKPSIRNVTDDGKVV